MNAFNMFAGEVKNGPIALVHRTPLMLAAPYGDAETIGALLKAGAHVDETDPAKWNPLIFSKRFSVRSRSMDIERRHGIGGDGPCSRRGQRVDCRYAIRTILKTAASHKSSAPGIAKRKSRLANASMAR